MRSYKDIVGEILKITGNVAGGNSGVKEKHSMADYSKQLDFLEDRDTSNPFYILMPGVTELGIQKLAMDVSDTRGNDCRVILDTPNTVDEDKINKQLETIDNPWGEGLAGWVTMSDIYRNKEVVVPPTVLIGRTLADAQLKSEYGSAAGENRGILKSANSVVVNFTKGQKEKMQAARINPVIVKNGVVMVYNNMTLTRKKSVYSDTNTVNVNCALKKAVIASTERFVFEDNRLGTWNRWKATVDPILQNVAKNNGVYDYLILMGEKDGTVGAVEIDTGYMPGIIKFKPVREAKWIPITFSAYSYGVDFKEEF